MEQQLNSVQELSLTAEILRDLLDNEIMFIGGGESATSLY
jgi:hypothetical protein